MASQDQERTERVDVHFSDADLVAIEEFRFYKRLPTTAAAVLELMKLGLLGASSLVPKKHH